MPQGITSRSPYPPLPKDIEPEDRSHENDLSFFTTVETIAVLDLPQIALGEFCSAQKLIPSLQEMGNPCTDLKALVFEMEQNLPILSTKNETEISPQLTTVPKNIQEMASGARCIHICAIPMLVANEKNKTPSQNEQIDTISCIHACSCSPQRTTTLNDNSEAEGE